ncbi:NADH:flavin oxidoreductase [Gimesia benthica]|uniref:NADH:flavin oxidoreductase n=1 Tax=Gimesia benthica TaxID=2608982 RepID=A0A6I6AGF8_9PLAN|nr:NADH:flavin oxidoreductase [Gimesia benthica]QGQ25166.1 NADH:flavin oxidoreductase [Gimesia benthica]
MAKYFKYKTPEDVVADSERLGCPIEASDNFKVLYEPIQIGHLPAKSRLGIQPMEGCDGTTDGFPDELTYRRYRRFGAGGASLIWGEATAIGPEARMNPRQLMINDQTAPALEKMLAGCREAHAEVFGSDAGQVIGLQLTHSGRFSFEKPLLATHDQVLDPRTVDKGTGRIVDDSYPLLSDDDLKRIEDQYVAAAKLAQSIGVDFVDIKQCHRYLLSELLAAKNRPGEYGGSLENRTRLVRNVIQRIREECPGLIIATRMNGYDGIPYQGAGDDFIGEPCPHELPLQTAFGTNPDDHLQEDLTEPLEVARLLKEWGISMINISNGNPYANPHIVRPAEFPPTDGYHAPEHPLIGVARHFRIASQIQAAVPDIPVVGSGYSWLQDFAMHAAAANVEQGKISIVGMGRATLSQPEFAKLLQEEGKLKRKTVCRTFSYCTNLMRTKDHPLGQYPTGCPPFDKEVYDPLWKEAKAKLEAKQKAAEE